MESLVAGQQAKSARRLNTQRLQTQADLEAWDSWLRDCEEGHYRHSSWWLESLRRIGIDGTIFAVRSEGRFLAGAAVLEFGFKRQGILIHVILHGPVALPNNDEALDELLNAIRNHAAASGAALVQFTAVPNSGVLESIERVLPGNQLSKGVVWGAYTTPDPCCVLSLKDTEESLWSSLSQGARRKIRKAAENGVRIRHAKTEADFRSAHRVWQLSSDRKHFMVRPYESIGLAMEQAVRSDMGVVLLACSGAAPAASIFVAWSGRTGHYISGGFDSRFSALGASYFVQWEAIKILRSRGLAAYDLGNHSDDGVGQFKLSLGAQICKGSESIAWIRRPFVWKAVSVLLSRPAIVSRLRSWARRNAGFEAGGQA